ncbi:MAG: GntR family transcriptional regulator [Methylobacteriaceae bacterium]|nr:GntR family transcriptional regulator [Methylobacteriaceae bacterium]
MEDAPGTLSDRVYRHLADRLMSGRFAPGDKLSLRAVAEALGVSMMPVRAAVSRLSAESALDVSPKRAVLVPLMGAAQFRDLTRVRIAIEGAAVAFACDGADAAARREIARRERAFRLLSRSRRPDLAEAVEANQAFHFALYRAAGSPELLAIIERLWLRAGPVINLDLRENPERLKLGEAVRFHAAARAAVETGDAEAGRAAVAADIAGAARFILSKGRLPE